MADKKTTQLAIPLDSPKLGFSMRLLNSLEGNGIRSLKGLLRKRSVDLLNFRGFGATMEREVREKLARFGLKLKDDPKTYEIANPCPFCGHKRDK